MLNLNIKHMNLLLLNHNLSGHLDKCLREEHIPRFMVLNVGICVPGCGHWENETVKTIKDYTHRQQHTDTILTEGWLW